MRRAATVAAGLGAVALAAVAAPTVPPAAAQSGPSGPSGPPALEVVLNGEDNRLNAYDAHTLERRVLIPSAADDPVAGLDINAEICFIPDGMPWKPDGELWFIAGEDTEQNSEPGVIKQGWGIFRLTGDTLESLAAEQIAKLVPDSFLASESNPENYGCGVLPDGRLVTGAVGGQLPIEPATGELVVWFIDSSHFARVPGADRTSFVRVPHCKIDVGIGTAGGIEVDGTDVYIASNRPNLATLELGGIYRYDTTVWPTGETAAEDCGRTDPTGEQLADPGAVGKSLFIPQTPGILTTPSDVVDSGRGTFFVSNVFTGTIVEYGRDGLFRRPIVTTTGQVGGITPFGIAVDSTGTLWIADIGILGPGPAPGAGAVYRVRFDGADNPGQPQLVEDGLEYPDGIGTAVVVAAPAPPTAPTATTAATPVAGDREGRTLAATGAPSDPLTAAVVAAVAIAALLAARSRRAD